MDNSVKFARNGQDYVMRSEKRPTSGNGSGYKGSNKRKPKRRRRKAGGFYIAVSILLSIVFWPLGMVMLWRRKLRWSAGAKLFASLVTLFLCIMLVGFALTVPTENDKVVKVQDTVNDFLDRAVDTAVTGWDIACERSSEAVNSMVDFGKAISERTGQDAATALTEITKLALPLHEKLFPNDEAVVIPDATEASEAQEEPPAPAEAETTVEPTPEPTAEAPEATQAAVEVTPESEATEAPAETEAAATPEPTAEVTEAPTPAPSDEPTEMTVQSKPASEAPVYYNYGSGTYYHTRTKCGSMPTADPHTLAEAREQNMKRCTSSACNCPSLDILDEPYVVWVDEDNTYHTTNDCPDFNGKYTLITPEQIMDEIACPVCGAQTYVDEAALGLPIVTFAPETEPEATEAAVTEDEAEAFEIETEETSDLTASDETPIETVAPDELETAEATEAPEETFTATVEPTVVKPTVALKSAGDATVYHSSNGSYYHKQEICSNMTGSKAYKLSECSGYKHCNRCNPPMLDMANLHCLWQDEKGICHTSDECEAFEGDYTLIERDEALKQGLTACPVCGAAEYLQADTIIDYGDEESYDETLSEADRATEKAIDALDFDD